MNTNLLEKYVLENENIFNGKTDTKELNKIIDDLKKDILGKFNCEEDYINFLDKIALRNHKYSYNNMILIMAQKPDCSFIAPFKYYTDNGYKVNKGEKGIKILAPNYSIVVKITDEDGNFNLVPFKELNKEQKKKYYDFSDESITTYSKNIFSYSIGHVFDISQTNMPFDEIEKELQPILENNNAAEIIDSLIKAIYSTGFTVKYENMLDNTSKGHCNLKNKEIVLRKGLNPKMGVMVLTHEYAHAITHFNLEQNPEDYKNHRGRYEIEAQGVAYTVCKFLGIDSSAYSSMYIYGWGKENGIDELEKSLKTIIKSSSKIIDSFKRFHILNEFYSKIDPSVDLYDEKTIDMS